MLYLVHILHIIRQTNIKGMLLMQKGGVVNLKHLNKVFVFLRLNSYVIILTSVCISGISLGIFGTKFGEKFLNIFENYTEYFLCSRTKNEFLPIFFDSLLLNFCFLLLIFIFGTSVTGITLAPILIFIRSLFFGAVAGIVYSEYSLKGIALNALILIPPTLIAVVVLIASAREAMKFSLVLIKQTLPENKPQSLSFSFGRYCIKNLLLLIPVIFSSILDGWLSIKLFSFFEF